MIVKIKRGDDFEVFEVENKNQTILEILDEIRDKQDRSLTYRSFCRSSICGTCAVRINGVSKLACKTRAEGEEIVIEPLSRVNVIKDLVVDHIQVEKSIKDLKNWFVDEIDEEKENLQTPEELRRIEKQVDCIMCMACFSECEALDYDKNFAGPFAFTKVFRFVEDTRDKMDKQERIGIAKQKLLYNCINCQKCSMVCPKGISSAMDIKMLQSKDLNSPMQDFGGMFF